MRIAPQGPERVKVLGQALEVRWTAGGRADRPAIVLLHEGLGSVAMWKDFPEQLAARTGCRVLAYSRQGYGASDPAAAPREPDYMHVEGETVLPALLDALGIERPILFAHSDGASIALIFAGRHPERARALILEAPHVFVEEANIASIAAARSAYQTTDLPQKLARYHADPDGAFWGWNDIWLDPRFRDWNIEPYLAAIACPVLLIQGTEDEYGSPAQLDAISARVAGARTMLLEACGHSPHRDRLDAVLDAAGAFVETLLAPAQP